MRLLNLPNILTTLRILFTPVLAATLIYRNYTAALVIFIFAAATDALDGLIARLTNSQTELGRFLDPLADKFLLITIYVLFSIYGWIPTWLTISIISKDLIIVTGWVLIYLIQHSTLIKPSILGKSANALQMLLAAYMLLKINIDSYLPGPVVLIWLTAATTISSGFHYIYKRGFVDFNSNGE